MKICNILVVFFICFTSFCAHSAEVTLSVDKKTISDGDVVKLVIDYNGDSNSKPDISTLQKDFQIVSQASSSSVNFINGQITQAKQWTLGLKPKKTGKITIKPITIDNITSNYIEIEVKELSNIAYIPDSNENLNSPYFQIEQSIFPTSPYVQEQTIILVTVYDSIGLQNGVININESTLNDWSVMPLSNQPLIKQEVINGKRMNVATFAFAAFAQKSGELAIPQFSFEGYYLKNNDIDLAEFDDFFALGFGVQNILGQKIPVRMQTKNEKITVKQIPESASRQPWLPLKNLTAESVISNNKAFKIGEAISRQLKITAVGAPQNMLPQINFPETDAFKQYPENPEITEKIVDGNIVTTTIYNTVYIPTVAGKQSLPSIEIDWFNVKTQQFEKTVIPAQHLFIENDGASQQNLENDIKTQDKPALEKKVNETTSSFGDAIHPLKRFWNIWYALGGFLFIIFLFWLFKKPKNPYGEMVVRSIKRHDYKTARSSLIDWAKIKFSRPDIRNLNMIADIVKNIEFTQQLTLLNEFMYSSKEEPFNSVKFIEIFKKIDKLKINMRKDQNIIPNLYD